MSERRQHAREAHLPERVASVLRDPVDERSVPRMWRRIAERRARPNTRLGVLFAWAALGAGAAVLVMAAVLLLERRAAPSREAQPFTVGALLRKDGTPVGVTDVPANGGRATIDLSDGSHISLEQGTHLETLASSAREFIVRLSAGTAVFEVEPFGPRRWVVEAGLASVEVVGTKFTVARHPSSVRITVERGTVLVRASTLPDGITRLDAGSSLDLNAPAAPAPSASAPEPSVAPSGARTPRGASTEEPWRHAAARGDYDHAYGDLGAEGLRRETARADSGEDLFALADVARRSGHPSEAVLPLERLEREFASSPRAPLAAVTLGRLELDLGNAARAGKAFERALALHVPAALEEDVYARLVEAYVKAGNATAARTARDLYVRKFPDGRRRVDIERWLGP